jgi:hypothetical protein
VGERLTRVRTLVPIDRMVAAYLLLTAAAVVALAGIGAAPQVVWLVVAALVVRDLLVGVSAALIWRRRPSIARGVGRMVAASVVAAVRGRR